MDVVGGIEGLQPAHGPVFAVIGVFDGLHRGHRYLLEHLRVEAGLRHARPTVITFDHHPDEILTGTAPPLLLDPDERLERLAAEGVAVTVVQHFDEAVRRTTYDAFIGGIQARTSFAGLLMTPDAAFGYQRQGTPTALEQLGGREGFDVVVIPTFDLDGRSVRSSDVRAAIAAGDLPAAETLLGRPLSLRALATDGTLSFAWPVALPPDGTYACLVRDRPTRLTIDGPRVRVEDPVPADGPLEVVLAPIPAA